MKSLYSNWTYSAHLQVHQLTQEAIGVPRQSGLKLNAMSMPEVLKLRERIQAALASKIEEERRELQHQIDQLSALDLTGGGSRNAVRRGRPSRVSARSRRGNGKAHPLKGRSVAPKYRDPENPSQTWREEDRHLAGLPLTSSKVASGRSS